MTNTQHCPTRPKNLAGRVLLVALALAWCAQVRADELREDHPRWTEARERVDRINEEIERQGARWTAGVTWVSLLDEEERLHLISDLDDMEFERELDDRWLDTERETIVGPYVGNFASSLDWRDNGGEFTTPVRNQRSCGSCWAFSAVGALEANVNVFENEPGRNLDLSEQYVLSCSGGSCNGWTITAVAEFLEDTGTPLESCLPYEFDDTIPCGDACAAAQTDVWQITSYTNIGNDVDDIKAALEDGPVMAWYEFYEDFYDYESGVYSHVYGDRDGAHAIVIIGWNDTDQAWLVRNSWGPNWGENPYGVGDSDGHFRIAWGECRINDGVVAIDEVLVPGGCVDADGDSAMDIDCGGDDCDDSDPGVHPLAPHFCDGVLDNDCDGIIDTNETDPDGDGFSECDGDCNSNAAAVYPGAPDICDSFSDNDCNGVTDPMESDSDLDGASECDGDCDDYDPLLNIADEDSDGYSTCDGDCADDDPAVHPGSPEICNHEDDNCDETADEGLPLYVYFFDADGDGYGDPLEPGADCGLFDGWVENAMDCDDGDAEQNPAGVEACNYEDDDCNGAVDDGDDAYGDPVRPTYYWDADGDGWGLVSVTHRDSCTLTDANQGVSGGEWVDQQGDCDDENAALHPDAAETCDGLDNDCDGAVDEEVCDDDPSDNDGDGYTEGDGDCDDSHWTVYPGAPELSDGLDNDCDGETDEDTQFQDQDGDGYSPMDGDCDDGDRTVYPGASETVDTRDNDCDGQVDEMEETVNDEPVEAGCGCTQSRPRGGGAVLALLAGLLLLRRGPKPSMLLLAPALLVLCGGCVRDYEIIHAKAAPEVELLMPVDNQRFVIGESAEAMAFVYDTENAREDMALTVEWQAEIPLEGGSYGTETLASQEVDLAQEGTLARIDLPSDIPAGMWTLVVRATDVNGEFTEKRAYVANLENAQPDVRILAPAADSEWGTTESILLLAEVVDDHLQPGHLRASWTIDATGEVIETSPDDAGQVFSVQRFLPAGAVTATLTVDDGSTEPVSQTVSFVVVEDAP